MVRKTARTSRTTSKAKKKKAAKARGKVKTAPKVRTSTTRATKTSTARKRPTTTQPRAQPKHEGVWGKLFKRVKPLFSKPLDPRIKQLVEVFGEEAVRGLVEVYRKSRETAAAELKDAIARAETMKPPPPHGSFVWHELMTRDVDAAKRFYGEMFGWSYADTEMMPGFHYTLLQHLGKDTAGMMAIAPEQGDMQPGWTLYVAVDDVDAAAERAEMLGGEIIVPPHDIPVGRWAMLRDPAGATICIYKAKQMT